MATRPSVCGAVWLGAAIGDLRRRLQPGTAAAVEHNLMHLGLAGDDPRLAARAVFRAFGLFLVELLCGLAVPPRRIARGWRIHGAHHLERLNRRPRGWILAGAHTGNWEHLGCLAAELGRPIVAPTGTQFHPLLSGIYKKVKAARGVHSAPTQSGWRGLVRALDRGALVALPLDGGSYARGAHVRLRGQPVRLAAGAARLARMSGCPILPVFSRRTAFMRQTVWVHPPIFPPACDPAPSARPAGGSAPNDRPGGRHAPADPATGNVASSAGNRPRDGVVGSSDRGSGPVPNPRRHRRTQECDLAQRLADLLGEHLEAAADQWCIFRPLEGGAPDAEP